jgi:membrane protein implicated in regulation of membrane protease activity
MPEFAESFSGIEKLYLACAVLGGILFVVRLVLQFVGGDGGSDYDAGGADIGDIHVDGDFSGHVDGDLAGHAGGDAHDAYLSFKILSFQGLTAFFMMFGLVGLAMSRQSGYNDTACLAVATAAGLGTVWIIAQIFRKAGSLQASGNINLSNAVGQEGEIYLTIPADGTGKAKITIQDRLRIYNAIAQDKTEIRTGQRVRVVSVTPQDVLVVEKLE